ncbi:MAG: type I-E CRISPR-associated protein Cse1/CasA, partial [Erysipelotrichaceae bacterium]|nr:type I-E CRISPR-associated protein Cse1/CasA [Erysipelotrichaceae bacterium]
MENEKRFSLLNNPWIKVVMKDGTEKEVSLLEIFPLASDILMLNGELETQNAAVLRLLLAIMYASFITNSGSDYQRFKVSYEAVDLWESIWKDKKLPTDLITSYLNDQEDNFWLIHPTKPFMQSPIAKNGTEYKASKLFGDLSESSNKQRLFQSKSGESKERCSFAEAARWLLYLNAYDDTSAKPKAKGLDSPGAGWLGQLGQIYVRGNDLFETLMLNFCLLKDGEKLWPEGKPYWELNKPAQERERIEFPKSPVEMLTLRSRWLLLQFNGDDVIGFTLLGGNHVNKEYPLTEQYTV